MKVKAHSSGSCLLYDNALNTYIFKDKDMSNILYNYHIKEKENNKYENFFKAKIKDELENIQKMFIRG